MQLEITERLRAEEEIRFLLSTIQAISQSVDFHSALEVTLCQVCETIGWDFGEAWMTNSDAQRQWRARYLAGLAGEFRNGAEGIKKNSVNLKR